MTYQPASEGFRFRISVSPQLAKIMLGSYQGIASASAMPQPFH